ncbi:MAG: YHYH protein [Cyanobacteria bacterium SZAS-4]|nr:YHYH protein [Cyanobacteria bacterium SZAS-4]
MLSGVLQPVFAHHELGEEHHHSAVNKSSQPGNDDPWHLLDFALTPAYALTTNVRIFFEGNYRVIDSNGIPNHPTGQFPNQNNPNSISEQSYQFRMLREPVFASTVTALFLEPFGVAVNGIPFDPGANEFWNRDRNSGWQYEPMFQHSLGLDDSNAHVQPNGAYHYHGLPTGLLNKLAQAPHPVLIGYAADGFPIYAPFGYKEAKNNRSSMTKLRSSYRLKGGTRPSGPGGRYDGSFVQDYEYVANAGDLDQCNGRFGVTTEYPKGIYHYIVTDTFPYIPRQWKGTPDESFLRHGHTGRGGGRQGGFPPGRGPEGGGPQGGFPPGRGPEGGGPQGGFPPGGGPGGAGQQGGFPPGGGPRGAGQQGGFPPGDGPRGGAQQGGYPPGGGPRGGGGGQQDGLPPRAFPPGGGPRGGGQQNGFPPGGGPPEGGPPGGLPGGGPPGGRFPGQPPESN